MFDLIGDIHGHTDALENLLAKLHYQNTGGTYHHPKRKVLFVGDYIDRGPKIRETLHIVRHMVEAGSAIALMGNHEYNAVCFQTPTKSGGYLRAHSIKNILQHIETLKQFQNREAEYQDFISWFKTLPLYYEDKHLRAVHACWESPFIDSLKEAFPNQRIPMEKWEEVAQEGSPFYHVLEVLLKGKELTMPTGQSFFDKDGNQRSEIRIKWWLDPSSTTYRELSILHMEELPETTVATTQLSSTSFYQPDEKPVFFGHYWLKGEPALYRNNICCLDYSVAKKGHLVAYRYDGETILSADKLVAVKA